MGCKLSFCAGVAAALLTVSAVGAAHAELRFEAGFSRAEITPPLGTPLSGYYGRRIADGVLDPLHARCLALSDGETRALIFAVDNCHLHDTASAEVREEIARKTKVPLNCIFLACTHTHTASVSFVPREGMEYWETPIPEDVPLVRFANRLIAERCADAGVRALADLAPASILIGRGEAKRISFIRRYRMKDGTVRTNPGRDNPDVVGPLGTPDEQLQLVRFVREGKREIALVNFQCHPDTISGTKISADWPGLSCTYLEDAMHGEIDAIFINGAQGDTNHLRVKVAPGEVVPRRYEMAKHMARTVAGCALSAWGTCAPVEAGKVRAEVYGVKAKTNKGTADELPLAEERVALHRAGRGDKIPGTGMERVANIAAAYRILELKNMPEEVEIPISLVTVGNSLAFGGFPGEPFTWMGTELKAKSPFAMTIPACCVNGLRGYFPVKSAYAVGGYENATSRYKAGTAEMLVESALSRLQQMHAR